MLRERVDSGSLVHAGRRDVEIIALRTRGRCASGERRLHRGFAFGEATEVAADADNLREVCKIRREVRYHFWFGGNGAAFALDIIAIRIGEPPVLRRKQPDADAEGMQNVYAARCRRCGDAVPGYDREIGFHQTGAVECSERLS